MMDERTDSTNRPSTTHMKRSLSRDKENHGSSSHHSDTMENNNHKPMATRVAITRKKPRPSTAVSTADVHQKPAKPQFAFGRRIQSTTTTSTGTAPTSKSVAFHPTDELSASGHTLKQTSTSSVTANPTKQQYGIRSWKEKIEHQNQVYQKKILALENEVRQLKREKSSVDRHLLRSSEQELELSAQVVEARNNLTRLQNFLEQELEINPSTLHATTSRQQQQMQSISALRKQKQNMLDLVEEMKHLRQQVTQLNTRPKE